MSRFSQKLDELPDTAAMLASWNETDLAASIANTRGRQTIAVGSGGSAIAATFFARCRETLFGERTSIQTPLELVTGNGDLDDVPIWLFSAGADNPDTRASLIAAEARGASEIHIVTRNPSGSALDSPPKGTSIHVVPVADPKDGFLATHSLVATVGALLVAADRASNDPVGGLATEWLRVVTDAISPVNRALWRERLGHISCDDTILLATDPGAATLAELIETSVWEASLCPIQRTDLRNLAHGRHSWLYHRAERTTVIGLIGVDSRKLWERVSAILPTTSPAVAVDLGDCGRQRNATGLVHGLAILEALGSAVGIDPGKPGIGEFGRALYNDRSLLELAERLSPNIRQKRDAMAQRGDPAASEADCAQADRLRRQKLREASINAIVLDYDGTIVPTDARTNPPSAEIVAELVRLWKAGVALGIATGRGGSAGTELRKVLPDEMHTEILVGYYNGAHLVPLSVVLENEPATPDPDVARIGGQVRERMSLWPDCTIKDSGVQLTIHVGKGADPSLIMADLRLLPTVVEGRVRVARSGHSIDVVPASAAKLLVAERLRARTASAGEVICIGDSGASGGNDCDFLSHPFGISVGTICGREHGSHSIFGSKISGPQALIKMLRCIAASPDGQIRLDVDRLYDTV